MCAEQLLQEMVLRLGRARPGSETIIILSLCRLFFAVAAEYIFFLSVLLGL